MTNAQRQYQQSHHISLASDSERKSALKNAVDWWYANAQKLPGTLAELDFQFAEYKEVFGYYPSPENFGIHLVPTIEKTNAQQLLNSQSQATQGVMTSVLLRTDKIDTQPGGDHAQSGEITVVAPLPRAERRRAPKTGYDYANSEYGAAAQTILEARPKLARYIAPACERVLSVLLAWRSHPLFLTMNGREGRYTSLGLDRLAREACLTTKTVKGAIKALQAAQVIETTLAGLELGTEQRVPVPEDELLVLKADCQLLTVEQGGGAHGYLTARCWQPNQQKSTSRATSNVFYVLKKDVWADPAVRGLAEFNPFAAVKSFSSTGKNAQQGKKDVPERTLAVVPTVTDARKGLEKDVVARFKNMKNTRKGREKSSSTQKRTLERLKRTSRPIPTSFQRTHVYGMNVLNEYIEQPVKPKSMEQGQERNKEQHQQPVPVAQQPVVTSKRKTWSSQLNETELKSYGLLLNAHTKFAGLKPSEGSDTIKPMDEAVAIQIAQDFLPSTVFHVISKTVEMAIDFERRNPVQNPIGLLRNQFKKRTPDAGQSVNLNAPSKEELLKQAEAYYQENASATATETVRRLGTAVAEGTNDYGSGTGRRFVAGNGTYQRADGSQSTRASGAYDGRRSGSSTANQAATPATATGTGTGTGTGKPRSKFEREPSSRVRIISPAPAPAAPSDSDGNGDVGEQ
jgi:hypothetical protein